MFDGSYKEKMFCVNRYVELPNVSAHRRWKKKQKKSISKFIECHQKELGIGISEAWWPVYKIILSTFLLLLRKRKLQKQSVQSVPAMLDHL